MLSTINLEPIARAICRAMNIDPDGYNSAHKFHGTQHRFRPANGNLMPSAMETVPNWRAAEHVAWAALQALSAMMTAP